MGFINENIYENKGLFSDVATNEELIDFFQCIPEEIQELWPYNFDEYKTGYNSVKKFYAQAGMVEGLKFEVIIRNEDEEYIIANTFSRDDTNFNVEMISLYASIKSNKKTNFSKKFLDKFKTFLYSYDKIREKSVYNSPCEITLYANSEINKDGLDAIGGYVWANHDFDFKNNEEMINTQNKFFNFAKEHNIKVNKRHLKKMTKPSDFASLKLFEVVDKFGKTSPLGKAFLLQHSWRAKWDTTNFKTVKKINFLTNMINNLKGKQV